MGQKADHRELKHNSLISLSAKRGRARLASWDSLSLSENASNCCLSHVLFFASFDLSFYSKLARKAERHSWKFNAKSMFYFYALLVSSGFYILNFVVHGRPDWHVDGGGAHYYSENAVARVSSRSECHQ